MAINLWGVSPLYEFEGLKEESIPTLAPIDKILDEGNCGKRSFGASGAIHRGKEACECAGKLTEHRRQPHSRQSGEATNRNPIQGRCGQASGPMTTKPSSNIRIGKSGACAAKVNRLIPGDLENAPESRARPKVRAKTRKRLRALQKSAEAIVLIRHTPLTPGRAEL